MKTLEEKLKQNQDYLAKSAQHLFVVNDNILTKVITFTRDEKLYFAKLTINKEKVYLDVYNSESVEFKWESKNILFPTYVKTKSIPYFSKMKQLVKFIESEITVGDNKALIEKISEKVKDLQQVKVE